jgi:hypothetical protein
VIIWLARTSERKGLLLQELQGPSCCRLMQVVIGCACGALSVLVVYRLGGRAQAAGQCRSAWGQRQQWSGQRERNAVGA